MAVLRIATFLPVSFSEFTQVIQLAANHSKANGIKNLMIDVMGNGGGAICRKL